MDPNLTTLEGEALREAFSGSQMRGFVTAGALPPESFYPDGRYTVYSRGLAHGTYWVDGEQLCVRTPRSEGPECRYFAIDPTGRVYQTGSDQHGVKVPLDRPEAVALAPLED